MLRELAGNGTFVMLLAFDAYSVVLDACYSSEHGARYSCLLRAHTPAAETDLKPRTSYVSSIHRIFKSV